MKRPSPFPILAAFALTAIAVMCDYADGQLIRRPFVGIMNQRVVTQPATVCLSGQCAPQQSAVVQQPFAKQWAQAIQDGSYCPEPVYSQGPVEPVPQAAMQDPFHDGTQMTVEQWYKILVGPRGRTLTEAEKAVAMQFAMRAARTYQGNGCGTSDLCGRDSTATYWMTNAHVATTTIGKQCRLQVVESGVIRSFAAVVVEAAYSSRTRTDWALLKGPPDVLPNIEPIRLSKEKPDPNKITITWGCPRCEPVRGQVIETVSMGSVWYWQPNSIGGQSGSAMVQDGRQVGLLTWTENGNGSGQFTANIWAQSRNQNTDGPARTGFEIPVTAVTLPPNDLREGYFSADKETGDLGEYPIWADQVQPPTDPVDPTPAARYAIKSVVVDPLYFGAPSAIVLETANPAGDGQLLLSGSRLAQVNMSTPLKVGLPVDIAFAVAIAGAGDDVSAEDRELLGSFRDLRKRAKERGMDWAKLIALILQLIELIQSSQGTAIIPAIDSAGSLSGPQCSGPPATFRLVA